MTDDLQKELKQEKNKKFWYKLTTILATVISIILATGPISIILTIAALLTIIAISIITISIIGLVIGDITRDQAIGPATGAITVIGITAIGAGTGR